jgi:hypothetical protein
VALLFFLLPPWHQPHISLPVQPLHTLDISRDRTVLNIARVLPSIAFVLMVSLVLGTIHHRASSFLYSFLCTLHLLTWVSHLGYSWRLKQCFSLQFPSNVIVASLPFLFTLHIFRDIPLTRQTTVSHSKYSQPSILPHRPRHYISSWQCRFGSCSDCCTALWLQFFRVLKKLLHF